MPITRGASREQQEQRIGEIVAELSLSEKIFMLSGHGFLRQIVEDGGRYCARLYHVGAGNSRLGIPPLSFMDGPRGIAMGSSTCFPVSMARGASFDADLEQRIGDAIGRELRAHGGNLFGGVCINLLRHPAWGRAQETYGEDPFLLGEMGAALVRGVQRHNVVATPKHFAANSMENARFQVDVSLDEQTLREVYLPHFKRCIDEGAGAVMSAYNQVNGAYCGHNARLLTGILKDEWGFDGFVYSDFILGCRGPDACQAGLDVEAPDTIHFGAKLEAAVEAGDVSRSRIDDAVARVLRSLFRTLAAPDPETYDEGQIACEAHVALAREAAGKGMVLLRNDGTLPLPPSLGRLLVVGELADRENLGDHGSSRVFPPRVVTPLEGIRAGAPPGCEIETMAGDDLDALAAAAARADAVLVVAGYSHEDEGEYIPAEMAGPSGSDGTAGASGIGGDRLDLTLGARQEARIEAVARANPRTVVAVMAGSAVLMEAWRESVAGILMLWYPGMEGGNALADVLFGRVDPGGRLPFTIPRSAADLPFFDRDARAIRYDAWHGYTKLERDGVEPAFPFGFGLSYARFGLDDLRVEPDPDGERLVAGITVRNESDRPGRTVVQAYAGPVRPGPQQTRKRLCGFVPVELAAGEERRVALPVALKELAGFDVEQRRWTLAQREWCIRVGLSSADGDTLATTLDLAPRRWSIRER